MKNFDWTRYTKKIAIKAPLHSIYAAWTTAEELERWFLEEVKFYDRDGNLTGKQVPAENDFTYKWRWHLYDDIMKGKILEANGKDFFQFTFEGECIVEVKLTTDRDYTLIELTHKNIPTDDESKQYIRLGCASGWTFYLINLKSVYEGGLDLRNKDEQLHVMINN
ncbi:SRPBCC domain-containing protein [Pedobacter heparinus]|uniref:SRPBCC family protein n=1 Tax=Pedobacter heparinus TaxID=984 RepID=UPI00292F852F|nr:SRPBCC domain-containing protein [Pedobacter heparinus]